jgi:TetR/AcrR family transcriptional regulator, transcriptional repressor for nem operon
MRSRAAATSRAKAKSIPPVVGAPGPGADPESGPNLREQSKAETREALTLAALAEFAEHGLEAPSLDAICARAGYTRGAFYVHFKDRDELIAAVMQRLIGAFLDAMIATGDAGADLERTVTMFAEAVENGAFPFQASVRSSHVLEACARAPIVRDRYVALLGEAMRRVSEAAREGQSAGSIRSDVDPAQLGTLLVGLVLAVQTLRELDFPLDVTAAAKTMLKLVQSA